MDILPPSFKSGSGAADENALRSADLRHQGATSVVSGYEGYRGPESSNWQYCRELTPEELAERDALLEDWRKQAAAENTGPNGTFKTPENNQSGTFESRSAEKNGRIKEFARRGRVALAAFAVAVGGILGVGYAASEASGAYTTTTCQEFEMHGAKPLPDGTVEASSTDRGAIQTFLNENANGLSVDYLKVGTPQESGSEYSGMFRKGTVAEVCVTRNPISGNTDVDINTKVSPSNPSF
jgi:hypothetical protein